MLFDAVGTLIYPNPPVDEVYAACGQRYGLAVTVDEMHQRFAGAFAQVFDANNRPTSEHVERQRWRGVVEQVFAEASQAVLGEIFEDLWTHFAEPASWRLFPDVPAAWQELRRRGVGIAVASNFDHRLLTVCRHLKPLDDADDYFVSARVGFSKPDPRFYRRIEQQLQLEPARLLLVGDDWCNDVQRPLELGWRAVWLRRGHAADDCIETLSDLRLG